MIIVLPFLIVLFLYAVFRSWKEEDIYLIRAKDDFDLKYQSILIRRNQEGKSKAFWKE